MKTYLVTGGAGFIGSNFVHYMLKKYNDIKIINYDKLTYAGNLENLKSIADNPNYTFIQGDICDKSKLEEMFQEYDIDYVVNFAAESHVDRSIKNPEIFVQTNVLGTVTLLNTAKNAWSEGESFKSGKNIFRFQQMKFTAHLEVKDILQRQLLLIPTVHTPQARHLPI
jgi:dTDP-D-glucose 4,6-dehydratase